MVFFYIFYEAKAMEEPRRLTPEQVEVRKLYETEDFYKYVPMTNPYADPYSHETTVHKKLAARCNKISPFLNIVHRYAHQAVEMLYATDRRRQPTSSEIREILKTIDLILGAETGLVLNASEFDFIPGGYEKIREFFTRVRTELREKLNPQ